jgi:hypothetical protein
VNTAFTRSLAALAVVTTAPMIDGAASAQTEPPNEVAAVVVTAERAGLPIWRLTRGAGTVVLVGAIDSIPGATPWRPAALEAAVARASAVVLDPQASMSPVDIGRVVLRARKIAFLPKGETVASRYGADLDRRLAALAQAGKIGRGYTRMRPMILSQELMKAAEGPHARDHAPEPSAIASRAARKAKVPRRPLLETTAKTLLDDLTADSPEEAVCLRLAIEAAEAGPASALERGRAWRERRLSDVLASPLERAQEACSFGRAGPIGDAVRAAWRNTVEVELTRPGVVVAVAPLSTIASPNGILDTLQAQGVDIVGPRWKTAP